MKDFDLKELVESRFGENYILHDRYVNRTFATVLKTIGFDKCYKRAKGAYLYDADGNEYLDFLTGYGVFGMGRNHPVIAKALKTPSIWICQIWSSLIALCLAALWGSGW